MSSPFRVLSLSDSGRLAGGTAPFQGGFNLHVPDNSHGALSQMLSPIRTFFFGCAHGTEPMPEQ